MFNNSFNYFFDNTSIGNHTIASTPSPTSPPHHYSNDSDNNLTMLLIGNYVSRFFNKMTEKKKAITTTGNPW